MISYAPTTLIAWCSRDHANADALSRLPLPESIDTTPQPAKTVLLMEQIDNGVVTADMIRSWTRKDPILSRVHQFVQSGWPTTIPNKSLHPYWDKRHEFSSQDGCLLWGNRVMVPLNSSKLLALL